MLPTLFAFTMFLAAALSFLIQPMIGKQLLPMLGGTPGVWNSCLVFFQILLLLGYWLSDQSVRSRLAFRSKILLHTLLLTLAAAIILIGGLQPNESWIPTDSEAPLVNVLAVLAIAVGAPYLALAMTAPLLQSWYARFGRNPYPLYAASNLGSFTGLLGYPLAMEPFLTIGEQRELWLFGFLGVALAIILCGVIAATRVPTSPTNATLDLHPISQPPSRRQIARWIGLAALPSSLLMSVTTHLTTDLAPVPLLWVLPLGLYLFSFVIVFAKWTDRSRKIVGRITPMFLCFLSVAILTRANTPIVLVGAIHLLTFFLVALLSHGELAADRPAPDRLTSFYLWISVGGVFGGLINTFVAPWLFVSSGPLEYPIAVVLAGLIRPPAATMAVKFKPMDGVWPFALGVFTAILVVGVPWLFPAQSQDETEAIIDRLVRGGLSFGLPAALAFALVWRPIRFTLCLAVLMIVGSLAPNPHGNVIATHRNYFGTLRVTLSEDQRFHKIVHGTTLHGQQLWPSDGRPDPATYYHRKGPFGRLIDKLSPENRARVGVVGLGCGATAAYADAGQHWTFYEIDPAVVRIASDPNLFTFLSTCPANVDIVLGDARRQLTRVPDAEFDLLVLDAFSSDSVPVHLLTREALSLYLAKLKPDGVLALHVSNRYLDLPPVIVRGLFSVEPNLIVKYDNDIPTEANKQTGQTASMWIMVARRPETFGKTDFRWIDLTPTPGPVWTDDFSSLLIAWRRSDEP